MTADQKRVEEIRARHIPCLKSCDAIWLLDLLREQQAELEKLRHRTDDKAPGTMACRFRGVCEFSQKHAGHNPYSAKSPESTLMESFLAQQAELERETAVRKTAESEAHNHAIRTAELYIEREAQQAELEALRKDREQFLRQRTEAWREAHSLREALNRLVAASACLCTPGMEEGCCRCQAYSALNEERLRKTLEKAEHDPGCEANFPVCAQCGRQATLDNRGGWDCLIGACGSVPVIYLPCNCHKSALAALPAQETKS